MRARIREALRTFALVCLIILCALVLRLFGLRLRDLIDA